MIFLIFFIYLISLFFLSFPNLSLRFFGVSLLSPTFYPLPSSLCLFVSIAFLTRTGLGCLLCEHASPTSMSLFFANKAAFRKKLGNEDCRKRASGVSGWKKRGIRDKLGKGEKMKKRRNNFSI